MAIPSIRVLVVDDYEPFRRVLCSTLQNKLELRTLFEASDGVEAIELAQVQQPDLILLDIGLPKANGIEATRRIRQVSPQSKILFVSQESSVEVVQGAFSAGASGYVVKIDVERELPAAVKAVLRGERFVGIRFAGHGFTGTSDDPIPGSPRDDRNSATLPRQQTGLAYRHDVGFHSDDRHFLDFLTQFIGTALKAGDAAIVLATESHRASLLSRLQAQGIDIGAATMEGRFVSLDVANVISAIMRDGMPDPVGFVQSLENLITTAAEATNRDHPRVALFGECAHFLWTQGNVEAALQAERLANQLTTTCDVEILCGYFGGSAQGEMDSHMFHRVCAEHSAVYSR